jgi:hypothetical protein
MDDLDLATVQFLLFQHYLFLLLFLHLHSPLPLNFLSIPMYHQTDLLQSALLLITDAVLLFPLAASRLSLWVYPFLTFPQAI